MTQIIREQPRRAWHTTSLSSVHEALGATTAGFSSAEAASRLAEYGRNQLPHRPPPAWWQIVLRQFRSPLIYILGLSTEPVAMLQWLTLVCLALTVFVGIEIHKWSWKRRTLQP